MIAWLAPLAPLIALVASDVGVYVDARRLAADGSPVFVRIGGFTVGTPLAWLVACAVLWIVFFPTYLVSRNA